jgi:uncharacterized RDD family membrane protein YckC
MNWHYAVGGQQQGPVDDAQLDALIRSGQVNQDTLVWREGMANWLPLRQARPSAATGAAPPVYAVPTSSLASQPTAPDQVVCAECGKIFTKDNAIQYGATWVCAGCKPVFLQKLREGTNLGTVPVTETHYAGFWIRFVAKFIDWVAAGIVIGIPIAILVFSMVSNSQQNPSFAQVGFQLALQFLATAFGIAYNTFMIGKWGATLGKMAVGIRVVTPEGQPISYLRAFGRAWADLLSGMICYIGYIIAAFDSEKRALHDHICSTRVVYK